MIETLLLQKLVLVVSLGIAAQWLAWKFRIPSIVMLMFAGIIAGPILGWINPATDFGRLVSVLIKIAVAIILFEGGLNLRVHELKDAGIAVRRMVIIGLPLSWVLGTAAAYYVAGLSFPVSVVLGAILVVTGPTVIMPLIRQTRLSPRISSLLKWEGIVNDPIGALLAVIAFEFFISAHESSLSHIGGHIEILTGLGSAFILSIALGVGGAFFLRWTFNGGHIPEYLKVPCILCMIILIYGAANGVQEEAGLLAVTVFGFSVGHSRLRIITDLRQFKEYITVFLVSAVFIILSATLKPEYFLSVDWRMVAFFVCILFFVRPISIWVATARSGIDWKERFILGWIAPRGVVAASIAALFAPRMISAGYEDARYLVPTVFLIVLLTVILHGFSLGWIARLLGLASSKKEGVMIVGASPWSTELAIALKNLDIPVLLVDASWHHLRDARIRGVQTYYGEILSELSEEELDLTEMGYLLASSDNDAYNALVCSAFAPHFGREKIFQLALQAASEQDAKIVKSSHRGRLAFGQDLNFHKLLAQHYSNWRFQKTTITKEFKFEDFRKKSPEKVEPILLIQKKGSLVFDTSRKEVKPESGDILLSYTSAERLTPGE